MAVPLESHWIPRIFKQKAGLTRDGLVTPDLIPKLLADPRFSRIGVDRSELELLLPADGPVSYAAFVSAIFDRYGAKVGKPLVGDKTPNYALYMPMLHGLWPQAKFVHLIRDGRDVCLSMLAWKRSGRATGRYATWAEDPVSTTASWWRWHVLLAQESGARLGDKLYYEVRYEALVADPDRECVALCNFLDVPYDDAMLKFHVGRENKNPDLPAKTAWRPVTSGLRNWDSQMSAADQERFEAVAGDVLEELGYGRGVPNPSAEAIEHAARMRDQFNAKPLPQRW
jgi:hypothetical protein